MKINLCVLGSLTFFNLLKELEIFDINFYENANDLHDINNLNSQTLLIIFPQTSNLSTIKKILLKNLPLIFVTNDDNFLKNNQFKSANFVTKISQPIDLLSFIEIIKILFLKYNFFKNSNILLKNNYCLDFNQKIIYKNNKNTKLTEKEINIIILLNNSNSLSKEDLLNLAWNQKIKLDSHAF